MSGDSTLYDLRSAKKQATMKLPVVLVCPLPMQYTSLMPAMASTFLVTVAATNPVPRGAGIS